VSGGPSSRKSINSRVLVETLCEVGMDRLGVAGGFGDCFSGGGASSKPFMMLSKFIDSRLRAFVRVRMGYPFLSGTLRVGAMSAEDDGFKEEGVSETLDDDFKDGERVDFRQELPEVDSERSRVGTIPWKADIDGDATLA